MSYFFLAQIPRVLACKCGSLHLFVMGPDSSPEPYPLIWHHTGEQVEGKFSAPCVFVGANLPHPFPGIAGTDPLASRGYQGQFGPHW